MAESLRETGKTNVFWSFMMQGGKQLTDFITSIILARLLLPEQFGLIGMIQVFILVSRALMDGGFGESLIRDKNTDNEDLSSVFFINLGAGIFLYGLLFISAPFIADFYSEPILTSLTRVLGLQLILNPFSKIQTVQFQKGLKFKTHFKLQFPCLFVSAGTSIVMAFMGFGVWSLIARHIVYSFLKPFVYWGYTKWKPTITLNKAKLKYHFDFGYKLSLQKIVDKTFKNLYNIVIGRFYSAAQLGFFTRATAMQQLPSNFFLNAIKRVFYPLMAKVNESDKQLRNAFSRLMKLVTFVVTPILIYIGIVGEPLFRWLIGEKWLPAVPYFQLLLIAEVFHPLFKYNTNIFKIKGRTDTILKLSFLQNGLLLIGAFSAIWFGIYGLLYSVVVANIILAFINSHLSGKLINYSLKAQIKDLLYIFILNAFIGLLFYGIEVMFLYKLTDLWNLILTGLGFAIVYIGVAYIFKMEVLKELLDLLKKNKS